MNEGARKAQLAELIERTAAKVRALDGDLVVARGAVGRIERALAFERQYLVICRNELEKLNGQPRK